MELLSAVWLCISVCIASQLLRDNGEIRLALVLLCVAAAALRLTGDILQIKELVSELLDRAGLDAEYLTVIFKGLGICYVTQISADCCRDCGQSALAAQIEIAGKLSMAVISLPLFRAVIETVEAILM